MSFSTKGRTSLAFSTVVIIRPCSKRALAKLRFSAKRWLALRPSFRPAFKCRIVGISVVALSVGVLERSAWGWHTLGRTGLLTRPVGSGEPTHSQYATRHRSNTTPLAIPATL